MKLKENFSNLKSPVDGIDGWIGARLIGWTADGMIRWTDKWTKLCSRSNTMMWQSWGSKPALSHLWAVSHCPMV